MDKEDTLVNKLPCGVKEVSPDMRPALVAFRYALIREIQELSTHIIKLEKILDRQQLIDKAKKELLELETVVPMVEKCGSDYNKLYDYVASRAEKEKRKEEIIEQQTALDNQGFSVKNINACRCFFGLGLERL